MVNENVVRFVLFGVVIYLLIGVRIVKSDEWLVVTRFGKYCGFRKQGIHWVVPFVDKTIRVDLRQVSPRWEDTPDQILETKVHEWVSAQSED
jgi:regulator of protease activity HflC (stomatin/prohibitin superfamily)